MTNRSNNGEKPQDLSHYLGALEARVGDMDPIHISDASKTFSVEFGDEVGAVAVGLLMLEKIASA
ncbi:MAG: hypothetical protein KC561_17420, partial [Myxococcales bacterium]|nr:hypothetical protein [Myxococcales bacterium]